MPELQGPKIKKGRISRMQKNPQPQPRKRPKKEVSFKPLSRGRYRVVRKDGKRFIIKKAMLRTFRNSVLHQGNAKKPAETPRAKFDKYGWIDCPHCHKANGKYSYRRPKQPMDMRCSHCSKKFIGGAVRRGAATAPSSPFRRPKGA